MLLVDNCHRAPDNIEQAKYDTVYVLISIQCDFFSPFFLCVCRYDSCRWIVIHRRRNIFVVYCYSWNIKEKELFITVKKVFMSLYLRLCFFFALSYCVCCCWTHKSGFNSLCDLRNDEKMMENSKWEKSVSTQKNVLLKSIRLWQPLLILRSSNRIENNGENTIRKLKTHSNFQFNPISTTFQCFQCLKEKCLIYFSYSTFH